MRSYSICLSIFILLSGAPTLFPADDAKPPPPRNVILMIGDGMGLAQLSAARLQKGRLAVEDMPCVGFSFTHSLKNFITDSSASATALATGYLILNGDVGIHPDGTRTKTVLEYAEEKGMWTGLVVTCRVTHATPASMVAHVKSRAQEDEIAAQMAYADVEVILGGGWDKFLPLRKSRIDLPREDWPHGGVETARAGPGAGRTHLASGIALAAAWPARSYTTLLDAPRPLVGADGKPYGARTDGRNLIAEMEKRGYTFVRSPAELAVVAATAPRKTLGLFHSGPMPKVGEGRSPSLSAMSLAALKILSRSPAGFFLMIEGSQIDWGGHANDFGYAMLEAADFDDALATVQRFLKDAGLAQETLIILTADHETGGLSLNADPNLPLGMEPKWTTKSHTGEPVPVFSSGPGAEVFSGIQSHEQIGRKLIERVAGHKVEFRYPETVPAPVREKL